MTRALVLAGGGVTGIAWETGVLLGMELDPASLDLVIGTSAGAAVGAQLLSGKDLEELYARQLSTQHGEISPDLDLEPLIAFFTEVGDISQGPVRAIVQREVEELRAAGAQVTIVLADNDASAVMGANPLYPGLRPVSAEAGRRQGQLLR